MEDVSTAKMSSRKIEAELSLLGSIEPCCASVEAVSGKAGTGGGRLSMASRVGAADIVWLCACWLRSSSVLTLLAKKAANTSAGSYLS